MSIRSFISKLINVDVRFADINGKVVDTTMSCTLKEFIEYCKENGYIPVKYKDIEFRKEA
jgi:hypothetical protein